MDSNISFRVLRFTEKLLDRVLSSDERAELSEFVDNNYQFVEGKREVVQVAELATEYYKMLSDKPVHTQELNLTSFMKLETFDDLIYNLNPKAMRKRAYMCLDSKYARFNDNNTKLSWDFTNNLNAINNSTNVTSEIKNITWIRMHSMVVRRFNSDVQRATILIEELAGQAFVMPSGRRFHFVGLLNDLLNPVNLGLRNTVTIETVPDFTTYNKYELLAGYKFNDGFYRFNKPITTLDTITISIGNPDQLVTIPKYEFNSVTVLDCTTQHIDLDLGEPHYYTDNVIYPLFTERWYSVFVDGFLSSSATLNNFINSREFTILTVLSPTSIRLSYTARAAGEVTVPPFTTVLPAVAGPWTVQKVRFNSYRVIMNFELEYICPSDV